jgi:hypothetical protein
MFRFATKRLAPKAAASSSSVVAPAEAGASVAFHQVLRMLGGAHTAVNPAALESVLARKGVSAEATTLAHLGLAGVFLQAGLTDAAAKHIDAVSGSLDAGAAALRTQLRTQLAAVQVDQAMAQLGVSGAGAEEKLATLSMELDKQLSELKSTFGSSWAVKLLGAELQLARAANASQASAAKAAFAQLVEALPLRAPTSDADEATLAAVYSAQSAVDAAAAFESLKKGGKWSAAVSGMMTAPAVDVAALPFSAKSSGLTPAEAAALNLVYAATKDQSVAIDLVPSATGPEGYGRWNGSSSAIKVASEADRLRAVAAAAPASFTAAVDAIAAPAAGSSPFADAKALEAVAALAKKNNIEGDFLDAVESTVGAVAPSSVHHASDEAFFNAFAALRGEYDHGCDLGHLNGDAESQLQQLNRLLSKQAEGRVRLGYARALDAAGEPEAALAQVDTVIADNQYLEMWRALQLRGDVLKQLGRVQEADLAHKILFELKEQPNEKLDIPLQDVNRDVSHF